MDCSFIGWCALKPEAQAAWVQAVFSVVAIAAAVAVPWWQHRRDAKIREEQAEAKAAGRAAAVLTDVRNLRSNLLRMIAAIESVDRKEDRIAIGYPGVPKGLQDQASLLPELGAAGTSLLRAIGRCMEARAVLRNGFIVREKFQDFEDHVRHAERHAEAALIAIKKMLS